MTPEQKLKQRQRRVENYANLTSAGFKYWEAQLLKDRGQFSIEQLCTLKMSADSVDQRLLGHLLTIYKVIPKGSKA